MQGEAEFTAMEVLDYGYGENEEGHGRSAVLSQDDEGLGQNDSYADDSELSPVPNAAAAREGTYQITPVRRRL